MSERGQKIIEGLREAVEGNFASIHVEGEHWVKVARTREDLTIAIAKTLREHMENNGWQVSGNTPQRLSEKVLAASAEISALIAAATLIPPPLPQGTRVLNQQDEPEGTPERGAHMLAPETVAWAFIDHHQAAAELHPALTDLVRRARADVN